MSKFLIKNKMIIIGVAGCVVVWGICTVAGYMILRGLPDAAQKPTPEITRITAMDAEVVPASARAEETIKPTTNITYEYVYSDDGSVEKTSETAPYFLLNMSRQKLAEVFDGWEIVEFSQESVLIRRTIEGAGRQSYIVGEQDGYISVFYQRTADGETLKEKTNVPISALNEEERERLREGVLVNGEDELLRVLEDYSS